MKMLIFSNADGELDLVNELLDKYNTDIAISLGDLVLASESTPLEKFLRSKYRYQAKQAIEWNKNGKFFSRPVYCLYGPADDPFIPQDELNIKNMFTIWSGIQNFISYSDIAKESKILKTGFISGYYNVKSYRLNNSKRKHMSRERKSLSLCIKDFYPFYKEHLDILFSYESPFGVPDENIGCPDILRVILFNKIPVAIHGHHRKTTINNIENSAIIGLAQLNKSFAILDSAKNKVTIYNHENLKIKNTIQVFYVKNN